MKLSKNPASVYPKATKTTVLEKRKKRKEKKGRNLLTELWESTQDKELAART